MSNTNHLTKDVCKIYFEARVVVSFDDINLLNYI